MYDLDLVFQCFVAKHLKICAVWKIIVCIILYDVEVGHKNKSNLPVIYKLSKDESLFLNYQAKKKYEIDLARKEKAARLGEGTWMLESVTKRLEKDEKVKFFSL